MPDANTSADAGADITAQPAFFVGIGGSGMMPLAMILAAKGARVAGSDRSLDQARLPAKFEYLRDLGVQLFPQDGSGITSSDQVVIASAAIEPTVPDMVAADRFGCPRRTRAEMLADLFNDATMPIAVGGTSGKSTVTGMIGWILHATRRDPTVMNGAVMKNFATPNAPFASALVGSGDAFVSEVDESDGSIALFRPRVAVLNNVSLDHKSLEELNQLFGDFIAKAELAVINLDNPDGAALARTIDARRVVGFGLHTDAEVAATDIVEQPFGATFTLNVRGHEPIPVELQVPGRHNISNALAAIAAARAGGVALDEAAVAIGGFTGLRRRFELVGETRGVGGARRFRPQPGQDRRDAQHAQRLCRTLADPVPAARLRPAEGDAPRTGRGVRRQPQARRRADPARPGLLRRHRRARGDQRRHRGGPGREGVRRAPRRRPGGGGGDDRGPGPERRPRDRDGCAG